MYAEIKESSFMEKNNYIQFLRGVSILAVVLTHCLGKDGAGATFIKPWLYFQVVLFVFLSGYLTSREKITGKDNRRKFYIKRLQKTLIPYCVWTVIYLAYDGDLTLKYFIKCLITAGACGPLYFLIDYVQLVLLTPILFKLLDIKIGKIFLISITPIYILLNYCMQIQSITMPVPICLWLVFPYVLGLEKTKLEKYVHRISYTSIISFCIMLGVIETIEGIIWKNLNIVSLMNTQVKLSTFFYSIFFILLCLKYKDRFNGENIFVRIIKKVGDFSFGIFLCHKLFIYIVSARIALGTISEIFLWAITVLLSVIVIWSSQRFLPKRICALLGFI